MMRKLILLALFSMVAGCMADSGSSMQLIEVMGPDQQCLYKEEGQDVKFAGAYDPTVNDRMSLVVRVRNVMNDKESDPRVNDNGANVRPFANEVSLTGFNVCYQLENELNEFGAGNSGRAVECDDIINATPGQYREFVPAGGTVTPDPQGQQPGDAIAMYLFSRSALEGIFGEAFLADRIVSPPSASTLSTTCATDGVALDGTASAQCTSDNTTDAVSITLSNNLASPGISEVDGWPWGEWADADRPSQKVLVVMQAVGTTPGGVTIKTNWLNFSVELCAGCREVASIAAQCPHTIQSVVCDYGTCNVPDPSGGPDIVTACVSPAGLADGATGCPGNSAIPCNGFSGPALQTSYPEYALYCEPAQVLNPNIENCITENPCTDSGAE